MELPHTRPLTPLVVEFERSEVPIPPLHLHFVEGLQEQDCLITGNNLTLSTCWQEIRAVFAPFKLIEKFINHLAHYKPDAVVFDCLNGVTLDLIRVTQAIGVPMRIQHEKGSLAPVDEHAQRWLDALQSLLGEQRQPDQENEWNYGVYALGMRDHNLLLRMQQQHVSYFEQSKHILDVGCGTGVMLEALRRNGLSAQGVERDPAAVRFARSLGHPVHQADALDFLAQCKDRYDALYCSHFVEHLPMDGVNRLVSLCAQALVPGGMAVFTFPDPESIRSQLLGFWRDPEHVRFYHPALIAGVAQVHGLTLEYNSQETPSRSVGHFEMTPPAPPAQTTLGPRTFWQSLFKRLGATTADELQALRAQVAHQQALIERLWQVNQTWAWEDNAVLIFRKHAA
jgi:2-polyprenyl-3-methyl-5-hydroxy-6-metoxy-1,4-benzoquinol methylase